MNPSVSEHEAYKINAMLQKAVERHRNNRLDEAEDLYKEIIQHNPYQSDALNLLGVIAFQKGLFGQAIDSISKAVNISPDRADFYHNLANALGAEGQQENAIRNYRKAITLRPNYPEAYLGLGLVLENMEEVDQAIACYQQSLAINPHAPDIWCRLGNIHLQRRQSNEAIECYKKAIQCNPKSSYAYNGLGVAFKESGEHQKAITTFRKAIELSPDYIQAYFNLGFSLDLIGKYTEAITYYKHALSFDPSQPEILQNLGNSYFRMEKFQDAIACYRKALEKGLNLIGVHVNLGLAYNEIGRADDALKHFQQALELKPDFENALKNFGMALVLQGRFKEAEGVFKKLLQHQPRFEYEILSAMVAPVIYDSGKMILDYREKLKNQLINLKNKNISLGNRYEQIGVTNFMIGMHGYRERELREQIANFYLKVSPELAWRSPYLQKALSEKRIRIGFVSKFLHDHTIGNLYHGLIENLSKTKFHVSVFRFDRRDDLVSKKIDQSVDRVFQLPKNIATAREIVAAQKLDILFYPELGMDPNTYLLSFARMAPVQCKRGFQITMGIPNIDYFISSKWAEPPGAQDHYSEELVLLERTGYFYHRPIVSDQIPTRKELGLPEDKKLYACPQSLFKLHPDFDAVIGNVLRKDPQGILVLLKGKYQHWETLLLNRFKRTIPDVIDRIFFVPGMQREKYLSLFLIADAVLDPIFICGGNTSLECFALGVPVVTWPSDYLPGRLTYGFYRQMGIMECVANNLEHYAELAVRLANDRKWYDELKLKIKNRSSLFFEDILSVREMEAFFEWAVQRAYEMK